MQTRVLQELLQVALAHRGVDLGAGSNGSNASEDRDDARDSLREDVDGVEEDVGGGGGRGKEEGVLARE